MVGLLDLPPELILHMTSFFTREINLDPHHILPGPRIREPQLVPDLPSINAFSQTSTFLFHTLEQALYDLCASVEPLGKLALLFAITRQLESSVDRLVAAGISLDTDFNFDYRPSRLLHISARLGLPAMVVKLLGMYGTEMTTRVHSRHGWRNEMTALDYAANHGHMEVVRLLAPIPVPSPDVSRRRYLGSALAEAISTKNSELCEYLISEGADVNFVDSIMTASPLYNAAYNTNSLGVLQLLLSAGADPNVHNGVHVPLFAAVRTQNLDIIQALIDGGADIHVTDGGLSNVLTQCILSVELLSFFLERGVDPNVQNRWGETPLHFACMSRDAESAMTSVELLLEFGAGPLDIPNTRKQTAVDLAMKVGSLQIVKILEPLVQNPDLQSKITAWRREREGDQ